MISLPIFRIWAEKSRCATGRHALLVDRSHPASTATFGVVLRGIARMFVEFPYWDVSYLIAVAYTFGCLFFIASGLFYWLPEVDPSAKFHKEKTVAGGVTAFVGAMLFEVGAALLALEAYNENQTGCFGWALHRALAGDGETNGEVEKGRIIAKIDPDSCEHHHSRGSRKQRPRQPRPERKWRWYPTWNELKTHYIHEIGFVANMVLSLGATLFCVTGICSIPGIYSNMSLGVAWGTYWLAYLIGGIMFMTASILYMLETQSTWYTPAPHLLGWHIGLWNLIGSVGWTLAASLGYCTQSWCTWESSLTLIWASVAFFIGSMLQWYEALEKYPIDKKS